MIKFYFFNKTIVKHNSKINSSNNLRTEGVNYNSLVLGLKLTRTPAASRQLQIQLKVRKRKRTGIVRQNRLNLEAETFAAR
jgi:hypothetical protein